MTFSVFMLCNHHFSLVSKLFHHPRKYLYPLRNQSSAPTSHHPQEMFSLLSVSMDLPILDVSYKRNYTICYLLSLAYFTYNNVFEVHPHCSMCQYFVPFYGGIIFYCIYVPQLFIQSSIDGHLGVFHLLAITNNAALNIVLQISVGTYVFTSLGYVSRSEIDMSYGHCMFKFLRNHQIVFMVATPYYISTSNVKRSYFSLSLPTLVIFHF